MGPERIVLAPLRQILVEKYGHPTSFRLLELININHPTAEKYTYQKNAVFFPEFIAYPYKVSHKREICKISNLTKYRLKYNLIVTNSNNVPNFPIPIGWKPFASVHYDRFDGILRFVD